MSADHTRLKGVNDIGESLLSDQLETNLAGFFSWGFLGIGAFFNVTIPTSGVYGGDFHRLRHLEDPFYSGGQVFQGVRKDWVFETGVDYSKQPIRVSGVFVDGDFHPVTGVGAYAHTVNYPLGQVVFDTPISPTSVVTCEYSHRFVQVLTGDAPWWRQIQTESFRPDHLHFGQSGSGMWSILSQNRVQLPAVVIQALPHTSRRGLALGGGTIVRQDVLFDVIAETPFDRNQLHDVVSYQGLKRIMLFDRNTLVTDNRLPLDENGSPKASGFFYPDMVKPSSENGYAWRQLRIENFQSVPQPKEMTGPLYMSTLRVSVEIDMP